MSVKTDNRITQDVLDELAWDPAITITYLRVSTDHGRVELKGTAETYGSKMEAEDAAYRVAGVKWVENDIDVDPTAFQRSDQDIRADICSALALDYQVPDDRINVGVLDGTAMLTGNVDWYYQRDAAENDVARIKGVLGIDDDITVNQPQASATDIASGISAAFARNGELYDDDIDVATDGGHVTLAGTVETWSEYDMAEQIAWMSPGVTSVANNIEVLLP